MKSDSSAGIPAAPGGVDPARRRRFKTVVIGGTVLAFFVLDVFVGSLIDFRKQHSFRTSHAYYHHGLRPDRQRVTQWGHLEYEMATNSLGFRDQRPREVTLESANDRIVVIGDSMIEGLGVDYTQTVAARLESHWSDRNVEVLNAGVVSYSPHLYELRVRHLLEDEGLRFDQLVVFIDISDIQDELFYEDFRPKRLPAAENSRPGWWRRNSLFINVVDRITTRGSRISNRFPADAEVNQWMADTEAFQDPHHNPELGRFEWTVDETLFEQWGAKGLALARSHMTRLDTLCREHGVEMTVVVYPSPVQIFASDLDSRQVWSWREFCTESDVRFIDLFPAFVDVADTDPAEVYQTYFISGDVHWNPAGHALVAERVAAELSSDVPAND